VKKLAALVAVLFVMTARADAPPSWATGSWATGSWAAGSWATGEAPPGVAVPNVIGQANAAAADAILEGDGLDLGGVTARCSAETEDEVVGQSPAPGVLVEIGSLVDVLVSNGVECVNGGRPGVRLRGLRMPGL
jgi:hypothetical protein